MKMRIIALFAGLLSVLPMTSARAGGTTTYYYGALKAAVSSTGGGKVYAATSNSAPSSDKYVTTNVQSDQNKSDNKAMTFFAFAQANAGYEFGGWATSDGGTAVSTDNPYAVSVTASSTTDGSPTVQTVYALFSKKQLSAFSVSYLPAASGQGSYTVNGAAPPTNPVDGLTEAYTPKLVATPAANYAVKGWYTTTDGGATKEFFSTAASCTGNFLSSVSVGVEFVPVVPVTDYAGLKSVLLTADAVSIASGVEIVIPAGETLAVPNGKLLVLNGKLVVVGGLVNSGTISGSGTVAKVSYCIEQGEIIKPVKVTGEEWGTMTMSSYHSYKPYYRVTTTTANTPKITLGTISGCAESWAVLFKGKAVKISKQSPKALAVTRDTADSASTIKSIADNADTDEIKGNNDHVLLQDCTISGPLDSKSRVSSQKAYDCAGHKATISASKIAGSNMLFMNGSVALTPSSENQNSLATFINCSSITLEKIKNGSPAYYFYDCGSASSSATVSFKYYSATRSTDYRKAYFYSGCYKYTFNATDDSGKCTVYNGSYTADPTAYLASAADSGTADGLEAPKSGSFYTVKAKTPPQTLVRIGTDGYETLQHAINAAASGATLKLEGANALTGEVSIPEGKRLTIDLNSLSISGGSIKNAGTLRFEDNSSAKGGTLSSPVVNTDSGTIDITYGNYAGSFTLNGGTLTAHNGVFTSGFSCVEDGGKAYLKGGTFDSSVALPEDFGKISGGMVCDNPVSIADVSYTITGLPNVDNGTGVSDWTLFSDYMHGKVGKTQRSDFIGKEAQWDRLAELISLTEPHLGKAIEATLSFDRAVAKGSISGCATLPVVGTTSQATDEDIAANTDYRVLISLVESNGYTAKAYKYMFDGSDSDQWSVLKCGAKNNSPDNIGTTVTVKFQIRTRARAADYRSDAPKYDDTFETLASQSFKFTGKGAIAGGSDYTSLATALENANYSGTMRLSKDCAEEIVIDRVCSFALDNNNFEFTGSIAPADGFEMKVADGVYTFTEAMPEGVAQIGGTVYATLAKAVAAAKAGDTIKLMMDDKTDITLPEGVALNTNGRRYSGTITTAEGFKTVHSDGVWSVESAYVAMNGGTGYGTLAEALAAEGAEIVITKACDESVTVGRACTVTVAEGVVFSGKINAADGFVIAKSGSVWTVSAAAAPIEVNVKVGETESKQAEVVVSSETVAKLAESEQKLTVANIKEVVEKAVELSASESEQTVKVAEETKEVPVKVTDGFAAVKVTDGKSSVVTELGATAQAKDQGTGVYQQTKVVEVEGEKIAVPDVTKPVVAVIKDQTTEETIILTVPGDTDKDGNPITVANVIASGMEANDQIKVYNSDGNYRWWEYNGSKWEARLPNKTDAEACQLTAGTAFWYTRAKGNANPIVVVAAYQEELKTDIDSPKEPDEPTVWNLVANANPVEAFDVDSIQCSEEGKSVENDKIIVPLKGLAQRTLTRKNGKWGYIGLERREIKPGKFVGVNKWFECGEEERKIEPGKGFWYLSNGGNPTLNWGKGTDK